MPTIRLQLPEELDRRLDREAVAAKRPKSELVRYAIQVFLERQERVRFQSRLLSAARARGDAESLAMADEFLCTENESLALAESSAARKQSKAIAASSRERTDQRFIDAISLPFDE
jgi:predicted transcriptional regulator